MPEDKTDPREQSLDWMRDREFLREERVRTNEALGREVNEEALRDALPPPHLSIELSCECGYSQCIERIRIEAAEYRAVHDSGRRFVIYPGHEIPELEDVVERTEWYVVIEKRLPSGE